MDPLTDIEQEVDQVFIGYFRDFSNLDLGAIVGYFHLPCTFIVPGEVLIFTAPSEVEAFWAPRFNDLRSQGFDHTVRAEAGIKELNSDTAIATSKAVRYAKDGSEMERRGAMFTLRKTGGDWKIAALIHHSADNVLKLR